MAVKTNVNKKAPKRIMTRFVGCAFIGNMGGFNIRSVAVDIWRFF